MKDWEINNSFLVEPDEVTVPTSDSESDTEEDAPLNKVEHDVIEVSDSQGEEKKRERKDPESTSALEKALERFSFKRLFMQTQRYDMSRAANPCLEIDDRGSIGLPLSAGVASSLMSGNSSSDNPAVLEIPAEKIRFQNPDWDAWLQKEIGQVCAELAGEKVRPSYRLRNLVLESTGSALNAAPVIHPTFELPPDAVGSLVIFLPSLFGGGQLECRHGIQSKTLDFAPESQFLTSVVVAYSDVHIARHAITSGCPLSLTYDTLKPDTNAHSMPSFPDVEDAALALEQAMEEWKEDETESEPDLVAARSLAGSDAILVAHLMRLAEKLDFQLYIVQLELFQSKYGEYNGYADSGAEVDPRKISGLETEDELTSLFVHAVDVQGIPVEISGFDFKGYDSEYLNGEIWDVQPQSEYDLFGYEKIRVDEKYDRTLFLLWPTAAGNGIQIRYSTKYACWALQASVSSTPSTREDILVDSLRAKRKKDTKEENLEAVPRVSCKCACQWSDLSMLLTTLEVNHVTANLALIGLDLCVDAYRTFGWNALKDFYKRAVQQDVSNPRRQELLIRLGEAARETADSELEPGSETKQEEVLKSFNRASISEVDWLLGLGTGRGADFVREVVYPQLKSQQLESAFWVHFARRLGENPVSKDLGRDFSEECVLQAVDNLPAFPTRPVGDDHRRVRAPAASSIMEVLKLCEETGNTYLCVRILEKMNQAADSGSFPADCPPWKYYLDLTRWLDEYIPPPGDLNIDAYNFQPFFKEAAINMLTGRPKSEQPSFPPCPFNSENLLILAVAIKRVGGFSFLDDSNKKILLAGRDSEGLKTLVRHLVAEWRSGPEASSTGSEHTVVLNAVVRQAIGVLDTKSFHNPALKKKPSSAVDDMVGMLRFCFDVGARSELKYLLVHFVSPPLGISISEHVSNVLAPFMPALRDYLATQGLTLESSPFAKCSASIIKAFADTVMCQNPQDLIAGTDIGCDNTKCGDCQKTLPDFFASDDQTIVLPRAAKPREHIEQQLAAPAPKSWGVSFRVIKTQVGAHKLEISKPDNMTIAGLWKENSERGKVLLALLGDESAQRRILGPNYDEVVAQIHVRKTAIKRPVDEDMDIEPPVKKARALPS
ncbi:hypothetical protein B0H19DRAFT_1247800 [Mycena capillaripes]|nr:hypothetical protein B0H19DRAFT_1247800 [Mycena capillaripes]